MLIQNVGVKGRSRENQFGCSYKNQAREDDSSEHGYRGEW